ncbi:Sapep family Mn(2+)-dependent dipeptidase [Eubacteriales bacterium OttesenSCG-928-N13]|nr:Sapep family Mn(2+)-dependent dipeptidase [Eubacteriales bacterium OttesenSCG-928-N13]
MMASETTIAKMNSWIDEHTEQLIREIQSFCRIRSVSQSELAVMRAPFGPEMREMLNYALMRAASYGFDTMNHDGYCGSVVMGDLNNAIGIFGHLDVVPEGDGWVYPPYDATLKGDFLIGRGVVDNKGACVMALFLMRMFKDLHIPLRHGIRLVLGCSEETGMQDIQYFAKTQVMPEVSLVPDMRFPANYAQKGTLRASVSIAKGEGNLITFGGGEVENMVPPYARAQLSCPYDRAVKAFEAAKVEGKFRFNETLEGVEIVAEGVAAHAAYPEGGQSAIHMLAKALIASNLLTGDSLSAMIAIENLSRDHYGNQAGIDCEDPETGKTTMVVGVARTREDQIQLLVDCRLSIAAELDTLEPIFKKYCIETGFALDSIKITKPFYMPKDDPRIARLTQLYQEMTGDDSPAYTAGGGTYSKYLENAITYGPGFSKELPRPKGLPATHGNAHAPDEYIHIPTTIQAMKIYAAAIIELDSI